MKNAGRSVALIIAAFATCCGGLSAAAVNYKDLAATRLPYGEAITINGDIKDFVASDPKLGNVVIADWAAVKKLSVSVTVEGLSPRTAVDATITGTTWTVAVDQFPKNASVKFDFKITVDLNGDKAGQIVDNLLKDDKFNQAPNDFFATATKKSVGVTATAKTAFITTIAPMVKAQLPGFLSPSDVKPIIDSLNTTVAADGWANAKADLNDLLAIMKDMGVTSLAGVTATSTVVEAFNNLKGITATEQVKAGVAPSTLGLASGLLDALRRQVLAFTTDYQSAVATFKGLVADLPVSLQLTDVSTVQDFAKYAGVDVGALYAPPAKSLRSFFTVNVYLGAVEDTPAHATPCQDGVSSKSMQAQIRQIASAQAKVAEVKAIEKQNLEELRTRKATLDTLTNAKAPQDQIAIATATQDRDSAQQLANAATAARQQMEKTAANLISPPSGRTCTFKESVFWQIFQQRFSVSGGVSIGDISGQKAPAFASEYAFVAGGGWRLNKYFRAFLGDLLYRNKYTDRINHTLCFGFSVDFSALGNITSVFGKVK